MNCKSVECRLSAYVDSELSGQEMLSIREHLRCCPACRQEETDVRGLKRLMMRMGDAEPPEGLEQRLTAAVLKSHCEPKYSSPFGSFALLVGVAGSAMIATFLILGTFANHPQPSGSVANGTPSQRGIDFDVQRDMVTSAIDDPSSGVPVMSSNFEH